MPPPSEPSRAEWLATRRQGIGGTDLAPILGLSKWKTPHDVWLDKTGRYEQPQNDDMRRGQLLEPVIKAMYEERHGVTVESPGHLQKGLMMGTPDGVDGLTVVEFKSTRWYVFKQWGGSLPMDYWAQMQHYMMLCGLDRAVLVVLVDGADYHEFPVALDVEWVDNAWSQATGWWHTWVATDTEPPRIDPKPEPVDGSVMTADDELAGVVGELLTIRELEDDIKARREQLETVVKEAMDTHEALVINGKQAVTWKAVTSSRLDQKRLKADHPELCESYMTTSTTRTFKITR